jgi:hypothetical protein
MTPSDQSGAEDPHREPDNSTVDDWLGQRVQRDTERAERIASETDDEDEAARRFDQESEAAEWHEVHVQDD